MLVCLFWAGFMLKAQMESKNEIWIYKFLIVVYQTIIVFMEQI